VGSRECAHQCLPGNGGCPIGHPPCGRALGTKVGSQHHIGVEQGDEAVEVAPACEPPTWEDFLAEAVSSPSDSRSVRA
jgi:hypothetical protein